MSKPEPHLGMHYETHGSRYYQHPRRRHASGDAEWHSRDEKGRRIHRAVFASPGVVTEGQWGDLAMRLAIALNGGEHD